MSKPWIYWRDECDYCSRSNANHEDPLYEFCNYERRTRLLRMKLEILEAEHKGAYGTLSFKCDYFILNKEKYQNEQKQHCEVCDG